MRARLAALLTASLAVPLVAAEPAPPATGPDDVVVVAIIDGGFDPYHLDWVAKEMPQHRDDDPTNDLPLGEAPHTWLPGFPEASAFATYDRLDLTMPIFGDEPRQGLDAEDREQWEKVETSTADATHYYWIPDSKVIGVVDFDDHDVHAGGGSHGSGTSSVSVGNVFGTCPQCVAVFIDYGDATTAEDATNWALDQPWIDVVTNSWGLSTGLRDRVYNGSDVGRQRAASERGQTILFSAGNGQANTFTAPNTTLYSSQEGPDWIITVGAISPSGGSYTGHGKPADVSSIGTDYPASNCASHVQCRDTFGGTSNATPVVAGMYARALHEARVALPGPSRVQEDGVVARGPAIGCGDARPDCELGDGVLTAEELRDRLLKGAVHTPQGYAATLFGGAAPTPRTSWEDEFLTEGHGSYFGRMNSDEEWLTELARIVDPMLGTAPALERPDGEAEWFVVDSFCRQQLWGFWDDGYYVDGETELPPRDPAWPRRSAIMGNCHPLPGPG